MTKRLAVVFALTIIFIAGGVFWYVNYSIYGNRKTTVKLNEQKVTVEVVNSDEKMKKGLSGRKNLCENCGMLFLLGKEGIYSFWMKEMLIDLDIIWIDGERIVKIERNVPADFSATMKNEQPADKVLELPAGFSDKHDVAVGDEVKIEQ